MSNISPAKLTLKSFNFFTMLSLCFSIMPSAIGYSNYNCTLISCDESITLSSQAEVNDWEACETVNGTLSISGADIMDLSPLNSLRVVENLNISNNPLLTKLTGLENLESIQNNLTITDNPNLFECCGIYNILDNGNIGGNISIENNNINCNTENEILDRCIADDCEEDVTLISQAEVNAWAGCETIGGILRITGADIVDLSPLSDLKTAASVFIIDNPMLTNLSGLENLETVEETMVIIRNHALTDLGALQNMTTVGGFFYIFDNDNLTTLSGLNNVNSVGSLTIEDNPLLNDINVFQNLTEVFSLQIINNSSLTNLEGVNNIETILDVLFIMRNANLENVDALNKLTFVDGFMVIVENPALTNVDGFSNLTTIGTQLTIIDNKALTNFDGFSSLQTISGLLEIAGNENVSNCCGFYPLFTTGEISGSVSMSDNGANCSNVDDVIAACAPIDCDDNIILLSSQAAVDAWVACDEVNFLEINGADIVDLSPLSSLKKVVGLTIKDNAMLSNLNGLENIESLFWLNIENNSALESVAGLKSLQSMESSSVFIDNPALTNLDGLDNLHVVGNLIIINNDALVSIAGLSNVTSVLGITINDNKVLPNINGLNNVVLSELAVEISNNAALTNLDGLLGLEVLNNSLSINGNPLLENLDGLSNVQSVATNLIITNNTNLSDCCGIYELLENEGANFVLIEDNPSPCSTESDVIAACNDPSVIDGPDLELNISANYDTYRIHEDITYTITLKNTGTEDIGNISVHIPEASAMLGTGILAGTGVRFTNFGETYDQWLTTWHINNLPAGTSTQLELVLFTLVENQNLNLFAEVTTMTPLDIDSTPDNGNNFSAQEDDEASLTLTPIPENTPITDIELYLTANTSFVTEGDEINYTLSVKNNSAVAASGVQIIRAPFGFDEQMYLSNSSSTGAYNDEDRIWTIGDLAPGKTEILNIKTRYTDPSSATRYMRFQLHTLDQHDMDSAPNNAFASHYGHEDDEARFELRVGENDQVVDLELELSVNDPNYSLFGEVQYRLTVYNTGTAHANQVKIDWKVPEGFAYVDQTVSGGQYEHWVGEWTVGTVAPGENQSVILKLWSNIEGVPVTNYAQVIQMNESDRDSQPGNGTCCIPTEDDEVVLVIGSNNLQNNSAYTQTNTDASNFKPTLFPNPATNRIYVKMYNDKAQLAIRIYNNEGKSVLNRAYQTAKGINQVSLDINSLPKGIYYLTLDNNEMYEPIRFVKQ